MLLVIKPAFHNIIFIIFRKINKIQSKLFKKVKLLKEKKKNIYIIKNWSVIIYILQYCLKKCVYNEKIRNNENYEQ